MIAAIVVAVVLVNRGGSDDSNLEEIVLEDIINGKLQPKRFEGTWVDGTNYYFSDPSNVRIFFIMISKN